MNLKILLICIIIQQVLSDFGQRSSTEIENKQWNEKANNFQHSDLLFRKKRYIVFPEGSTFNAAFCVTTKVLVLGDDSIFTEGAAWGSSYDLPTNTSAIASAGAGVEQEQKRRRDRRDLYRRFERAVDSTGLNGKECVLRAICEAEDMLGQGNNLAVESLRIILAIPTDRLTENERAEHGEYVLARKRGQDGSNCAFLYSNCPVSILSLATSLVPATTV